MSLVGHNPPVYKLRMMVSVQLHVNATYYSEYPALKSVYEKIQSVMDGKLLSSYRAVFELAKGHILVSQLLLCF